MISQKSKSSSNDPKKYNCSCVFDGLSNTFDKSSNMSNRFIHKFDDELCQQCYLAQECREFGKCMNHDCPYPRTPIVIEQQPTSQFCGELCESDFKDPSMKMKRCLLARCTNLKDPGSQYCSDKCHQNAKDSVLRIR